MSFKPYSEQSTINIDGLDYPCTYSQQSPRSWSAVCDFQGKTLQATGATRAEVERNLRYRSDE